MIVIGLGANLPSKFGMPIETCEAALVILSKRGVEVVRTSPWYGSAPVPVSDQPWFVNGLAVVKTSMSAIELLDELLAVETLMGRERGVANAARTIDLDLVVFDDQVINDGLQIPHPRMEKRAFVLLPLRDLDPLWCHPVTGQSVAQMIESLPVGQEIKQIP